MISSLLAYAIGTVSDIELGWTLIAFVGAIFSLFNVREAYKDFRVLSFLDKKNGRGLIARNTLKSEVSRVIIQSIFITIGILAMLLPEGASLASNAPLTLVLFGEIFRWGIITSSVLITAKAYWSYQVRTELARRLASHNELTEARLEGGRVIIDAKEIQTLPEYEKEKSNSLPSE